MTEPSGGGLDDRYEREGTPPPLTKEQIEGHISAIKSIIKDYNRQNKADPIRLDFGEQSSIPLKEGRGKNGRVETISSWVFGGHEDLRPSLDSIIIFLTSQTLLKHHTNSHARARALSRALRRGDEFVRVEENVCPHGHSQQESSRVFIVAVLPDRTRESRILASQFDLSKPPQENAEKTEVAQEKRLQREMDYKKPLQGNEKNFKRWKHRITELPYPQRGPSKTKQKVESLDEGPIGKRVEGVKGRTLFLHPRGHISMYALMNLYNLRSRSGRLSGKGRTKRNKNGPWWGFAGEVAKPLGKIDLEVCFGNEGLSRRMSVKFLVVRVPSPYNIILGRPRLKALHAIPSTIYSMIRFPTPKGIATLVTRATIIAECRLREGKQYIEMEKQRKTHRRQPDEGADPTKQILV
ncbi:hypothetical protein Tco_1370029 [Tanacetum coccineum]